MFVYRGNAFCAFYERRCFKDFGGEDYYDLI